MAASAHTEAAPGARGNYIPLVDFGPFLEPAHPARQQVADDILAAFTASGFIYLENHGIDSDKIDAIFAQSAKFFTRTLAEKDALGWTTARANRGYTCIGREKVSQGLDTAAVKEVRDLEGEDLKESFEIGRDDDAGEGCENKWPTDAPGADFKRESLSFFEACKVLHMQVMRAMAVGLGIDAGWFDAYTDAGDNTLRLLHYPPVKRSVFAARPGQVRAGAHSDYGSITLLFQDARGGLQVQGPHGWINATPIPGTIVVNAGDLLARWSNGLVKSTVHRVVEPPENAADAARDEHPARYSIAYFCNPNFDRFIEAIPGTLAAGEAPKYPGVNSGDYLVRRLEATY